MGSGKLHKFKTEIISHSLDWLFPPRCAGCGRFGEVWCQACRNRVKLIREPYCELCGSPKPDKAYCLNCASWDYNFDAARSWGQYSDVLRKAILSLKDRHNVYLGVALAECMYAVLAAQSWKVDLLVPVPLAPHRLAQRGYNQTDLLAQPLAASSGLRYADNLVSRSHETVKQFELHAAQRWENLMGAFQVQGIEAQNANILLVDDIMTTGATLNAASIALKKAGASRVYALTLAKTLLEENEPW